ncbi:MAG: 50S ribosomal protein L11 [Bacilli bacterium]|nr:50S ribosomal protein L11 [Bacilli bacterium]
MPAKKILRTMKIVSMGGEASPAKLGQKLGPYGIGGKFCMQFNAMTSDRSGDLVPCILTIYEDKSFDIVLKTTPVTFLVKKYAHIEKGAADKSKSAGSISRADVQKIAEYKMPDLTVDSLEAAIRSVEGTVKSMGVKIVD